MIKLFEYKAWRRTEAKERKPFEMEYRLLHHSDEYRWILNCGSPIYGEDGTFAGYIGSCYDINDEKQLKEKLSVLNREYETIFNTTQDPVILIDVGETGSFSYRRVSKAHEKYTGLTSEMIKGHSPREVFGEETGKLLEDGYRLCMKEKSVISYEEILVINSIKRTWHTVLSPIVKEGRVVNIVGARRDITDTKTMEKELEHKNKELREMVKELESTQMQMIQQEKMAGIGQLAAGVAHEINNPLGYIISNFNVLMKYENRYREVAEANKKLKEYVRSGSFEEARAYTEIIDQMEKDYKIDYINEDMKELLKDSFEGLDRISKIVKGLRIFSRLNQDEEFEEFDLNAIIENTLLVAGNEIKYCADIEKNLGDIPPVYGVPGQINQVLLNVILNSAHAIKKSTKSARGLITINTYKKDKHIVCEIIDNGTGIPQSIINQIFNPFFTTKPVGEGTGLGLSISYDIIKNKHNGDIEVESTEGVGTKFSLIFPC